MLAGTATHVLVPANPTVIDFIYPTLSALTVLLLGYIARKVAIAVKKFRGEHEWLMATVTKNTEAIALMLDHQERRLKAEERAARGPKAGRGTV